MFEWCRDPDGVYGAERPGDGLRDHEAGKAYAVRGGSFNCPAFYARSAVRSTLPTPTRVTSFGLRAVRALRVRD